MHGVIVLRLYLRPIQAEDGKLIVKWHNNPTVLEHCFNKELITEESNRLFFENYVLICKYKQFIVERIVEPYGVASYSIATIYLKNIDQYNKTSEMCMFSSYLEEWTSESKRIAIKLLIEKAFLEYDMRKIYTFIMTKYREEVDLLKDIGFVVENVIKDTIIDSSDNHNDVAKLCMLNKCMIHEKC